MMKTYWIECMRDILAEHRVNATNEQIDAIAGDIVICSENMGLLFPSPENPLVAENKKLINELSRERTKIVCPECGGHGRISTAGPVHSSNSQCFKCNGSGKID